MAEEENDDFMEIINNSELEEYMATSEIQTLTMRDLHVGLRDMGEAIMYITSFIDEFYEATAKDEDTPAMSMENVVHLRNMFEAAQAFCSSVDIEFEEEEESDDEEVSDEEENEEEE